MIEDKRAGTEASRIVKFCPRTLAPGVLLRPDLVFVFKKAAPSFLSEAEKANKRQHDEDKLAALAAQDVGQLAASFSATGLPQLEPLEAGRKRKRDDDLPDLELMTTRQLIKQGELLGLTGAEIDACEDDKPKLIAFVKEKRTKQLKQR